LEFVHPVDSADLNSLIPRSQGVWLPPVSIPAGTDVKQGITPGGQGPYNGSGGANEILVPNGLPPGSVGPWEAL